MRVFLVESRQKRAVFLRRVVAEAGLRNATVLQQRTETLDRLFDGVISRAYKPPAEYLSDAADLCKPGGTAVLLAGGEAEPAIEGPWTLESRDIYPVDGGTRSRWLLRRR